MSNIDLLKMNPCGKLHPFLHSILQAKIFQYSVLFSSLSFSQASWLHIVNVDIFFEILLHAVRCEERNAPCRSASAKWPENEDIVNITTATAS